MNTAQVIPIPTFAKATVGEPMQYELSLPELFVHEAVKPGLYVASGKRELVGLVSDKMVDLLQTENATSTALMAPSSVIGSLLWVDSGNTFDPYFISRRAVQKGLDPKRVLRSIQVARPFTAFQFQQMLSKIPQVALGSTPRSSVPVSRVPLVVVSDLMGLFYDADLQEGDLERAFKEFLNQLSLLKRKAIVVALLMDHDVPPQRRHLLSYVMRLAHRVNRHPCESRDPVLSLQVKTWIPAFAGMTAA